MFILLPIKSVVLSKEAVQEIITVMFVNKTQPTLPTSGFTRTRS